MRRSKRYTELTECDGLRGPRNKTQEYAVLENLQLIRATDVAHLRSKGLKISLFMPIGVCHGSL